MTRDELIRAAAALPAADRFHIACELADSLFVDDELDPSQKLELFSVAAAVDAGVEPLRDGAAALRQLRADGVRHASLVNARSRTAS